jgi:acyl-CoA-binding protein
MFDLKVRSASLVRRNSCCGGQRLTVMAPQGKAKYNKWAEFKDLSPEEAQKKYVEAVKKLVAKYK